MKIVSVSKCSLDIEKYVEFKMSVLKSPSKSLISSRWVTYCRAGLFEVLASTYSPGPYTPRPYAPGSYGPGQLIIWKNLLSQIYSRSIIII